MELNSFCFLFFRPSTPHSASNQPTPRSSSIELAAMDGWMDLLLLLLLQSNFINTASSLPPSDAFFSTLLMHYNSPLLH